MARAASSKTSGSYAHVAAAVRRRYPDMAVGGKRKARAKSGGKAKRGGRRGRR